MKTLATGECLGCKKDIIKPPSMFKYTNGYCVECANVRKKTGVIIATGYCLDCKIDIVKPLTRFQYWSGFCRPCTSAKRRGIPLTKEWKESVSRGRKGKLAGSEHWNWQGGITEPNDKERVIFKKTVRNRVLERDDFTCQVCSQVGGYLQVDHIKSWTEYPELRLDLDNCRTLCMACHYYVTFKRKIPNGVIWGHGFSKRVVS